MSADLAVTLSAIIPTWNEAEELPETLRCLQAVPEVQEIIVSDADSVDTTQRLALDAGARVVNGPRSRGGQLRRGAREAKADVIWLVHADTRVPPEAGAAITAVLANPTVIGGACVKVFRDPPWLSRGSGWRCRWRMRWSQFAYGDQAIFVRRKTLEEIGGVPDVPLMEEYLLCAALRACGQLVLAPVTVTTSARRLRQRGVLRAYGRIAWINLRYRLGASPEILRRDYERS